MGLSTSVSLIILVLILLSTFGVFITVVTEAVRLNDPNRLRAISKHIKEYIEAIKEYINETNKSIILENKWAEPSDIITIILINPDDTVRKVIRLSTPLVVPPFDSVRVTNETINQLAGYQAITPEEWNLIFALDENARLNIIFTTRNGNGFVAK